MLSEFSTMINFIGAIALSYLCGVITVLLVLLYLIHEYSKHLPIFERKPQVRYEKVQLGGLLHQNLHNGRGVSSLGEKESCCFVNVLFAFIFREWKDTNQLQKWVLKKINIEFMEFMETKTASRLLQGLKVHDVSLGNNFPVFHSAIIKDPFSFTDNEIPELVTLELDMEYHGGFYLAIDVDLVFGKTAFLAVRITYMKGRVRLQFGRHPCTHWSITFVEEPDIKFDVETSFETRQLPQLTSLIVNQIRRTIRRKHTLPQYKLRYNPFFSFQHREVSPFDGFISEIPIQPATLEVCIAAATRLLISSRGEKEKNADAPNYTVFATVSVNVESCIGKALLGLIAPTPVVTNTKPESADVGTSTTQQHTSSPKASGSTSTTASKSQGSTFDSLQRSLLGRRKDLADRGRKPTPKKDLLIEAEKEDEEIESQITVNKIALPESSERTQRADSISSNSSSAGASYVMVALNFAATLREETTMDGTKLVVVENITEHNVHGQSGMKDGDIVMELNKVPITSLSQAIATIERIRASKASFKFKVKRDRVNGPDSLSLEETLGALQDSDKSTSSSIATESDHSDVDLEDYKDFVNISLQVAELHKKVGDEGRRSHSFEEKEDRMKAKKDDLSRPHSSSLSTAGKGSGDAPYMTLVSAPTPSTSLTSLGPKDKGANNSNKLTENIPDDRKKQKINKVVDKVAARSRSESPPFFRRHNTLPKSTSTPLKQHLKNSGQKTNVVINKDVSNKKKDSSPVHQRFLSMVSPSTSAESTPETAAGILVKAAAASFCDFSDPTLPFTVPRRPKENLSYARVDDDADSQLFKTNLVNSNQHEYSWKHDLFTFNVKERHRYLNIRFWTQQIGKAGLVKSKSPQIVACLSVPLCELEMYCRGVTSRRVSRRFPLSSPSELPHDHKWFLSEPIANRSSFREEYCYGDTTLTVTIQPKPGNKNNSSNYPDTAGDFTPEDDTNGMMNNEMLSRMSMRTGSDFLLSAATRTGRQLLVSRQTQTAKDPTLDCEDANADDVGQFEGSDQPIVSHDEKAEQAKADKPTLTQILKGFLHGRKDQQDSPKGNVPMVEHEEKEKNHDDSAHTSPVSNEETASAYQNPEETSLHRFELTKFTTSTKCACCNNKVWTKTGLKCKFCSTVCHKKCVEKYKLEVQCPGNKDGGKSDEIPEQFIHIDDSGEMSDNPITLPTMAVNFRNKVLGMTAKDGSGDENPVDVKRKNKMKPMSKNADDMMAVNAKEMGKDLHRDLPLSERKSMLENQMQEVENELHSEIEEKEQLQQEQRNCDVSSTKWKKAEERIGKSDERLQALALLLLHYRAGLEDCDFENAEDGGTDQNVVNEDANTSIKLQEPDVQMQDKSETDPAVS